MYRTTRFHVRVFTSPEACLAHPRRGECSAPDLLEVIPSAAARSPARFCLLTLPSTLLQFGPTISPVQACATLDNSRGSHASDLNSDHLLYLGSTIVSSLPPRSRHAHRRPSLVLNQPERGVCSHAAPSKPECQRQTCTYASPQCPFPSPSGCVRHFPKRPPSRPARPPPPSIALRPAGLANPAAPARPRPPTAGRPLHVPKVCFTMTGKLRLLGTQAAERLDSSTEQTSSAALLRAPSGGGTRLPRYTLPGMSVGTFRTNCSRFCCCCRFAFSWFGAHVPHQEDTSKRAGRCGYCPHKASRVCGVEEGMSDRAWVSGGRTAGDRAWPRQQRTQTQAVRFCFGEIIPPPSTSASPPREPGDSTSLPSSC